MNWLILIFAGVGAIVMLVLLWTLFANNKSMMEWAAKNGKAWPP